jgi:hypothetical protein
VRRGRGRRPSSGLDGICGRLLAGEDGQDPNDVVVIPRDGLRGASWQLKVGQIRRVEPTTAGSTGTFGRVRPPGMAVAASSAMMNMISRGGESSTAWHRNDAAPAINPATSAATQPNDPVMAPRKTARVRPASTSATIRARYR